MTASSATARVTNPGVSSASRSATLLDAVDRISERLGEGSVIVDSDGAVQHANRMARRIVRRHDGIGMFNNRLVLADPVALNRYRHAIDSLQSDGEEQWDKAVYSFCARRPSGKRPYLLSVQHTAVCLEHNSPVWPAGAIAFIRDPDVRDELDTRLLGQSYDLSPAEVDLAQALDGGSTLREIAERRRVSITTVRSQLYTLMAKLEVKRQTDLVRLFASYRR